MNPPKHCKLSDNLLKRKTKGPNERVDFLIGARINLSENMTSHKSCSFFSKRVPAADASGSHRFNLA